MVSRATLPATAGAFAVITVGIVIASKFEFGPLSAHMALHIALMNVVAPFAAAMLVHRPGCARGRQLWLSALTQIALLWLVHAPPVHRLAVGSPLIQGATHAALFVAALLFWRALLRLAPTCRWQAIPALLLTGKLYCLLAVLIIFAPRLLYQTHAGHHAAGVTAGLADQQLAGLLMVAACPVSYLVAAVVLAAQIVRPERQQAANVRPSEAMGP